ncbi:peptidyl-prolyl cis-trans isomerase chloroplast precursor [Micromonas commoda]|uniref:peptidylprolyl isomerase n=1 Tax=Micromonas commoda (strain RCC299 / NOUM17 / CCMP2709) TaxID=296587 RepID=C1FEJ6_MICCC|nr:peptidyl-prolyl cis-trans isomerase chloroplast precursor [Micromonas commoda]ACO68970.1 peptidyl-prolyl cis-trans isomerase chloroplast precursor [Micromonas commoda]|eukprot:XP_002507712.1 peptidyl-prolyl cis-trans isomerase chloroplast precursor [Micromonas commoda]
MFALIYSNVAAKTTSSNPTSSVSSHHPLSRRIAIVRATFSDSDRSRAAATFPEVAKQFGAALFASVVMTGPSSASMLDHPSVIGETAGLEANPVTNARALLRNALPIDNKQIREVQRKLESISEDLRVPGVRFSGVESSVNGAYKIVTTDYQKILASVAPDKLRDGSAILAELRRELEDFKVIVSNRDKQEVPYAQQRALDLVGRVEEEMIDSFPFEVPAPYDTAPLLKGRAKVEMEVAVKDNPNIDEGTMTIVLDGFNAPVTAGNFVDLVQRGFYDGMDIQRSDGFVVQSGKPSAKSQDGFIDPASRKERTIPLEIMPKTRGKNEAPVYEFTFEDVGKYRDEPALPFNAFGTLAMARREAEPNSASSQFFFLLKESELTPSGTNILDGRYSVFGYVIDGQEILRELKAGDLIKSIKIVDGAEYLVNGTRDNTATPDSITTTAETN